jgi:hypothetical protein
MAGSPSNRRRACRSPGTHLGRTTRRPRRLAKEKEVTDLRIAAFWLADFARNETRGPASVNAYTPAKCRKEECLFDNVASRTRRALRRDTAVTILV